MMVLRRIIPQVHVMAGQLWPLCQSGKRRYERQSPVKVKHEEADWLIEVILLHDVSICFYCTIYIIYTLFLLVHLFTVIIFLHPFLSSCCIDRSWITFFFLGGGPDDSDLSRRWHAPSRAANRLHHLRTALGRMLCRGTMRNRR